MTIGLECKRLANNATFITSWLAVNSSSSENLNWAENKVENVKKGESFTKNIWIKPLEYVVIGQKPFESWSSGVLIGQGNHSLK